MFKIGDIVHEKSDAKGTKAWKITKGQDSSGQYGGVRWIKKNNKWSSNAYVINPDRYVDLGQAPFDTIPVE